MLFLLLLLFGCSCVLVVLIVACLGSKLPSFVVCRSVNTSDVACSRCCCVCSLPTDRPINQVFNAVNLGQIFVIAMTASAIWWQSDNVSDIAGAMFFISIQQAFNGLNTSMRVFPPERGLMIRERSTGSYRVGPYFLAKSTSDIGLYTVAPILYATAVYWCVGLRSDAGVFFKFLLLFMGQVRGGTGSGVKEWFGGRARAVF